LITISDKYVPAKKIEGVEPRTKRYTGCSKKNTIGNNRYFCF